MARQLKFLGALGRLGSWLRAPILIPARQSAWRVPMNIPVIQQYLTVSQSLRAKQYRGREFQPHLGHHALIYNYYKTHQKNLLALLEYFVERTQTWRLLIITSLKALVLILSLSFFLSFFFIIIQYTYKNTLVCKSVSNLGLPTGRKAWSNKYVRHCYVLSPRPCFSICNSYLK